MRCPHCGKDTGYSTLCPYCGAALQPQPAQTANTGALLGTGMLVSGIILLAYGIIQAALAPVLYLGYGAISQENLRNYYQVYLILSGLNGLVVGTMGLMALLASMAVRKGRSPGTLTVAFVLGIIQAAISLVLPFLQMMLGATPLVGLIYGVPALLISAVPVVCLGFLRVYYKRISWNLPA